MAERPNILLVDDRPENVLALQAILQGLPVSTVGAYSGEAALKQLLRQDFALILLDARMPEMDGFETARRIRQRERTRAVPIVFLTAAEDSSPQALRGYEAGAVDYLTKPVDPWVLRAKVNVLVELWERTARLREQADLAQSYERRLNAAAARLHEARSLVERCPGDAAVVRELAAVLADVADQLVTE